MKKEIWKAIRGYNGKYLVSNYGVVKSVNRIEFYGDVVRYRSGKILKQTPDKDGYYRVGLCNGGKLKNTPVHRLVAAAFVKNPHNKETVNHENGIKTDNSESNLTWATRIENTLHAHKNGLVPKATGDRLNNRGAMNHRSREVKQYRLDGSFVTTYGSTLEAERMTGFNSAGIQDCCKGRTKKSKGFIWKYSN